MTTRTDAQLIAAAASDPSAFRELYERYAGRIHGYLRRRTGDDEAAYDLTAETFAQAWLMRGRFRDQVAGTAGPWLFTIARNTLLMSVRRRKIEQQAVQRLGLSLERRAHAAVTPSEAWLDGLDDELEAALAALPAEQREALRLRVEDDLAYAEVARLTGVSEQAARVRVHRALRTLRGRVNHSIEVN